MNEKTKITLTPEHENLLIPLVNEGQPGNPIPSDFSVQDILDHVDYDSDRLRAPCKTVILIRRSPLSQERHLHVDKKSG